MNERRPSGRLAKLHDLFKSNQMDKKTPRKRNKTKRKKKQHQLANQSKNRWDDSRSQWYWSTDRLFVIWQLVSLSSRETTTDSQSRWTFPMASLPDCAVLFCLFSFFSDFQWLTAFLLGQIQTETETDLYSSFVITGTYQGQWLRGLRHGYGVRTSAPFGMASRFRPKSIRSSMTSLKSDVASGHHVHHGASASHLGAGADPAADRDKRLDDGRGGFVLKSRSDEPPARRRSFSERSSTIKKTLFQVSYFKRQMIILILWSFI